MADQFSKDQVAELKEIFNLIDQKGTGTIPTTQLMGIVRSMGQDPSEMELQDLIDEIDPEGSGLFDFLKFLTFMARQLKTIDTKEEIINAFRVFDKEGNGSVSGEEMRQVLTTLGEKLTQEEVNEMFKEAAVAKNNGQLFYEDFVNKMMKK